MSKGKDKDKWCGGSGRASFLHSSSSQHDNQIFLQSELQKVRQELVRAQEVIGEQKMRLEKADQDNKRKARREEEAAEIMLLQQEELKKMEVENGRLKGELELENGIRRKAEENVKMLQVSMKEIKEQLSTVIDAFPFIETGSGTGEFTSVGVGDYLKNEVKNEFKVLSVEVQSKLEKRTEFQTELKCEIEKMKRQAEKMNDLLARREITVTSVKQRRGITSTVVAKSDGKRPPFSPEILILKTEQGTSQNQHGVASNTSSFTCLCSRKFPQKSELRMHIIHKRNRNWKKCDICDKQFLGTWALTQHHRRDHCNVTRQLRNGCGRCGYTFESRKQLQSHRKYNCCNLKESGVKVEKVEYKFGATDCPTEDETPAGYESEGAQKHIGSIFLRPHV